MAKKIDFPKLIISIGLCLGTGVGGSIFTAPAVATWYQTVNKPVFNPPSWIFAPVWTVLYVMMGLSLYLIWSRGINKNTKSAMEIFLIQLALNFLWSLVFFGMGNFWLAYAEILLLFGAIVWTICRFAKVYRPAAYLLIPYLAWVSFASFLNLAIAWLN